MLKAKQLLVESDMAIVDVALACGFHHQSLFHSTFKSWFGVTPGRWRSQNRNPSPNGHPGASPTDPGALLHS